MGINKKGKCKRCNKETNSFDKDGWLCESCWKIKYNQNSKREK